MGALADAVRKRAEYAFRDAGNPPREYDHEMMRAGLCAIRALLGVRQVSDLWHEAQAEVQGNFNALLGRAAWIQPRYKEALAVRAMLLLFFAEILESEGL